MAPKYLVWLSVFGFVSFVAGCGPGNPQTTHVSGTVTLDGTPVEGAIVAFFHPEVEKPARGVTDASGNFTLTTFTAGDGAMLGAHKVSVTKVEESADAGAKTEDGQATPSSNEDFAMTAKHLLPVKYSSPSTSGLTIDVAKGMEPVKLELKSK